MKPKIEFFHDPVCEYCFFMSIELREFNAKFPEIDISHKSFALFKADEDFKKVLKVDRSLAKTKMLNFWKKANKEFELPRLNVKGMEETDFLYPKSINPLKACKAAYVVAGNTAYWDMFDSVQYDLFIKNKNIEDKTILESSAKKIGIDSVKWKNAYESTEVLNMIETDLELVKKHHIETIPCIIINEKEKYENVRSSEDIEKMLLNFV